MVGHWSGFFLHLLAAVLFLLTGGSLKSIGSSSAYLIFIDPAREPYRIFADKSSCLWVIVSGAVVGCASDSYLAPKRMRTPPATTKITPSPRNRICIPFSPPRAQNLAK